MRRPPLLLTAVGLWLVSEFVALWVVVHLVGWLGAIALGLVSTLAGIAILRRLGAGALRHLGKAMEGVPAQGNMLDGVLTAVGAVLLILPGFVSDLAGLALAAPSLRQWIARRFGGPAPGRRPRSPDVIDLAPEDWAAIDKPRRPGTS